MSIWNTVETNAWARDFNYEEYCQMHTLNNVESVKLSEMAYDLFCGMCDYEMDNDSL